MPATAVGPPPAGPSLRVLITTDMVGGVWSYAIELAKALKSRGCRPFIAVLGAAPQEVSLEIGNLPTYFFRCRLEWMQDAWQDVRLSGDWLLRLTDRLQPDLIHLNGYAHAARKFQKPVLIVAHSCVFSWYESVKGDRPGPQWQAYRDAVTAGLKAARGVTAPTAAMLDALRRHYGDFNSCPPIPNGRSSIDFPMRRKAPIIFSAGRIWDEAKNIDALARIAHRLSWPVIIAGEQTHPETGQVRYEAGRAQYENVRLLGFLPPQRFGRWLSRAAIYVLPAYYEPFGLTVLEAALAGCALVLGDIPSLRENWEGAAWFVPPGRSDLLQAALSRLISDDVLRSRYAAKARKRAGCFTVERMADRYLALYAELLGRTPNAAPVQTPLPEMIRI